MAKFFKCLARVAAAVGLILPVLADAGGLSDRVDSLSNSIDGIEDKVQSTLMSGGSAPVSFSGEARLKFQYHNLGFDAPGYMQADRSYFQSGWEGNENLFRLGMIVSPGRNTILYAKLGFQHTLVGNYPVTGQTPEATGYDLGDGSFIYPYRHDKARNSVTIHEDMSAGIAVRTEPASFWVRLGNTMWTEASPLTVWKAQPRTFAWEYLPFEVEQPIARYYEYNIAKGEKAGRAAWNKKPFNGINVESIRLPGDIYTNFIYGTFERYDNFEQEYIDFASDLGYGNIEGLWFPQKGHGVGDSYRHAVHARIAKEKLLGSMTLGLNYVGINYNKDVLFSAKSENGGAPPSSTGGSLTYFLLTEFKGNDSVFYKEPKTLSLDLKGPIGEQFAIHADVALNVVDTTWWIDTVIRNPNNRTNSPELYTKTGHSGGLESIAPAFYTKFNYNGFLPVELDLAYIAPGFYSPFSFAAPMDAFYAFGSNMVGAGKFIARGEGSPYTQNMAGANLTFTPKLPGYGHLRLKYGQHFNITEEGRDMLFFPLRLNGADMFSFFHSSYNRWGNGLIDNSIKGGGRHYMGRLGDESFVHMTSYNTNANVRHMASGVAGGLRSDFLAMYEGFVAYNSAREAYENWRSRQINPITGQTQDTLPTSLFVTRTTITNHALYAYDTLRNADGGIEAIVPVDSTKTSWVPVSRKYTFNLELDAAYDIGGFIGYKKDLFVGGYAGINGVTTSSFSALEFNDEGKNTLLWSAYLRLEPAIALHKNFYLLGLFGFENWRSRKSWMMVMHDRREAIDGVTNPGYGGVVGVRNPTKGSLNQVGSWSPGGAGVDGLPGDNGAIGVDDFVQVPVDYRDFAYGIGFDWDMLERVGLHGRVKWISHTDKGFNDYFNAVNSDRKRIGLGAIDFGSNDWMTPVFTLEVKTWF